MMKSDKSYLFLPFCSLECALYSSNLDSLWISTYDEYSWYEQWEAHSSWSSYVLWTDITQGVLASKFPIFILTWIQGQHGCQIFSVELSTNNIRFCHQAPEFEKTEEISKILQKKIFYSLKIQIIIKRAFYQWTFCPSYFTEYLTPAYVDPLSTLI